MLEWLNKDSESAADHVYALPPGNLRNHLIPKVVTIMKSVGAEKSVLKAWIDELPPEFRSGYYRNYGIE